MALLRAALFHDRQWKLRAGIDNLGNQTYWAFHPYTQRTFNAEIRYDY